MFLLSEESPLRRLPDGLNQRQRLILDGIRYAIDMADLAYNRLLNTLAVYSSGSVDAVPSQIYTSAFSDAWSVVDSVDRLRGLLLLIPGAKESPEVQVFQDRSKSIRVLRNSIQHLHARFDKLVSEKLPTWGCITWVTLSPEDSTRGATHMIAAGSLRGTSYAMENPAGKPIQQSLDLISLHAHGLSIPFSDLREALSSLLSFLERTLSLQFKDLPHAAADLYLGLPFIIKEDNQIVILGNSGEQPPLE